MISNAPRLLTRTIPKASSFPTSQIRSKHSARQVKRLFQNNPARIRKQNVLQQPKAKFDYTAQFAPVVQDVQILSNGWVPAPPEVDDIVSAKNGYPFSVKRTGNKPNDAVGFLPVYSEFRVGRNKHTTIVRKVSGDINLFVHEMLAYLNRDDDYDDVTMDDVRIRTGDIVEVKGIHVQDVKTWLAGLGF